MTDQHDLTDIPAKYATLKQAEVAGLNVPRSVLLNGQQSEASVEAFVGQSADRCFIVRSANLSEDDSDYSLAGHFWSSEAIDKSLVTETIIQAQQENQAVLDSLQLTAAPQLIVQEYVEHKVGGVLFSPWSFFSDYAYIECSEQGVKSVVEGAASESVVLSLDGEFDDPLSLSESLKYLKPELVALCGQLRRVYDFPVDCEWAYDIQKQCVVVLQVRPQTHLVGPILPCSQSNEESFGEWSKGHNNGKDSLLSIDPARDWQFTALSESLGRLSPLSFSLLHQLYVDAIPTFRLLGCKAKVVDFMAYAPDGTVLVDPVLEQDFYKLTLFGGFQRGMRQAAIQNEARLFMSGYDDSAAFSYDTLLQLFRYWMASNISSSGAGRESLQGASPHAYELAWVTEPAFQKSYDLSTWDEMNREGRLLFLFELNKLKKLLGSKYSIQNTSVKSSENSSIKGDVDNITVRHSSANTEQDSTYQRSVLFCTWSEYQAGNYQTAMARQHLQARYALYDYALFSSDVAGDIQSLASAKTVESRVFLIENPASFKGDISKDCILVAPYFDNRWVGRIRELKGIVVSQGSRLSHSAIVAREYDVPYLVMPELDLESLGQGQEMILEPKGLKPTPKSAGITLF